MEHVAIMKKEFLEMIILGRKKIESRWSKRRIPPFHTVSEGDSIYFKLSSGLVCARAIAGEVLYYDNLTHEKILEIIKEYGPQIGIDASYAKNLAGKNYCTLIFLKNFERITPFQISKEGYSCSSGWLNAESVGSMRI